MAKPGDSQRDSSARESCAQCGAPLGFDQRYCLSCGARRGEIPAAVLAGIVGSRAERAKADAAAAPPAARGKPARGTFTRLPTPRAMAAAILAMLGAGVLIGSSTSSVAESAPLASVLLRMPTGAKPASESEEPELPEAVEPPATTEPAPVPIPEVPAEEFSAPIEEAPVVPETVPGEPLPEGATEESKPEPPPKKPKPIELPEEAGLPQVEHVFVIALGDNGYEETFGPGSTAPYLAKELPKKGELLTNYYAVTQGSLANQIALLSGQGPTPETILNCPTYSNLIPGAIKGPGLNAGQATGDGCIYPKATETLPGQLEAAKKTWRAYVEDIDKGAVAGQPATCRHPAIGAPDPSPAPIPGDAYVTWRNPFVYFHSIIDSQAECEDHDVSLERLAFDLRSAKKTPNLSYIVPNACHSGGELPCEEGAPTGPAATEEFLRKVVPAIMASDAYKEGGLIVIASAQAPPGAAEPDTSSCCVAPEYPNLPPAPPPSGTGPVKATGGGGHLGLLLLSPFVKPGTVEETTYANHYTLLLTLEELFGLEKLGYAAEPALVPFGEAVFNRPESKSP